MFSRAKSLHYGGFRPLPDKSATSIPKPSHQNREIGDAYSQGGEPRGPLGKIHRMLNELPLERAALL
jgi:hypothetical protein